MTGPSRLPLRLVLVILLWVTANGALSLNFHQVRFDFFYLADALSTADRLRLSGIEILAWFAEALGFALVLGVLKSLHHESRQRLARWAWGLGLGVATLLLGLYLATLDASWALFLSAQRFLDFDSVLALQGSLHELFSEHHFTAPADTHTLVLAVAWGLPGAAAITAILPPLPFTRTRLLLLGLMACSLWGVVTGLTDSTQQDAHRREVNAFGRYLLSPNLTLIDGALECLQCLWHPIWMGHAKHVFEHVAHSG